MIMVLQMLLSALTQVLGAFHNLTYLDLSPTNVDGVPRAAKRGRRTLPLQLLGERMRVPATRQVSFRH